MDTTQRHESMYLCVLKTKNYFDRMFGQFDFKLFSNHQI